MVGGAVAPMTEHAQATAAASLLQPGTGTDQLELLPVAAAAAAIMVLCPHLSLCLSLSYTSGSGRQVRSTKDTPGSRPSLRTCRFSVVETSPATASKSQLKTKSSNWICRLVPASCAGALLPTPLLSSS